MSKKQKILLMRIDRLGDLILSLPAISAFIDVYPDADIDLVVNKAYHSLAAQISGVKRIYTINPFQKKTKDIFSLIMRLRETKYDLAIDLIPAANYFSSLLLFFVKARRKGGYAVGTRKWYLDVKVPPIKEMKFERDLVLDILSYTGSRMSGEEKSREIKIPLKNNEKNNKEQKIVTGNKKKIIIIHPATSSDWRRQWPKEYYMELIQMLDKEQVNIIFTGTSNEKKEIDTILSGIEDKRNVENYAGKTSLEELSQLLVNADVILSPLTGVTHLAVALEKSVITIIGPTPVKRWTSPDLPYMILKKEFACSPCEHKTGCIYGNDNKCMKAIKPQEVYEKIVSLIAK